MAYYDFKKDIAIGERGEDIIREHLEEYGFTFVSNNKDNEYDLKMSFNEKEYKFEIKTDVYCRPDKDTGNIFVEIEARNKESGIKVSKSNYFVNYFPYLNEIWTIKTNKLKELINDNDFELKENSGDNCSVKGYVIPRYKFKKHFKVDIIKKKW